jgi:hypothetical protein
VQLALRRGFGYAYDPFRGMRGLGDDVTGLVTGNDPIPFDPSPIGTTLTVPYDPSAIGTTLTDPTVAALQACAADPNCSMPSGISPVTGAPMVSTGLCADGSPMFADGSCAETSAAPGSAGATAAAAQLAAALARSMAPTTGIFGGAATSCPSGYVYGAPGASVQIAPGIATVGTGKCIPSTVAAAGIIPGVSNTTLAIAAVAFLALMMLGKLR